MGFPDRIERVVERMRTTSGGSRVVAVTHGGVIGSWVARMATEGATSFFPYLVHNCSISTFEVTDRGTACVAWDQMVHLEGLTGHE